MNRPKDPIIKEHFLSLAAMLRQAGEHGSRCTEDPAAVAQYGALVRVAEIMEEWAATSS
jgi:hypothetical protein